MIIRDTAKSIKIHSPSQPATELEEICSMCEKEVPDGAVVLRHAETVNILCVPCLGLIALLDD